MLHVTCYMFYKEFFPKLEFWQVIEGIVESKINIENRYLCLICNKLWGRQEKFSEPLSKP